MKGVILAGGFGLRLSPLTRIINKHLLPVYDRPMISYVVDTLKKSGLKEILLVTEKSSAASFKKFLRNGQEFGIRISYKTQKGAGGIAEALSLAKNFSDGDSVAVILGDNIFEENFKKQVQKFKQGATIFLKKVSGLERFGVPVFKNGKIVFIEEKPKAPKSPYAVTGFYIFDKDVFNFIKQIKPSERNELEITDVINQYLKNDLLNHEIINGYWSDAGTFESLLETSLWIFKRKKS